MPTHIINTNLPIEINKYKINYLSVGPQPLDLLSTDRFLMSSIIESSKLNNITNKLSQSQIFGDSRLTNIFYNLNYNDIIHKSKFYKGFNQ